MQPRRARWAGRQASGRAGAGGLPQDASALALLLLLGAAAAHPAEYVAKMPPALRSHYLKRAGPGQKRLQRRTVLADLRTGRNVSAAAGCLEPDPEKPQSAWWGYHCSISNSNDTFCYPNVLVDPPQFDCAERGDIIAVGCDHTYCPPPVVADCYYSPGICKDDEWCWHKEHEKFGGWGMASYGGYGDTSQQQDNTYGWTQTDYCDAWQGHAEKVMSTGNTNGVSESKLNASAATWCSVHGTTISGTWRPIQAQCVKYRTKWQSCLGDAVSYAESDLDPLYKVLPTGKPFERPLLCAPGLVCTGADYEVLPLTCVDARPKDKCFYGSWWDSTECPRTEAQKQYKLDSGMSWSLTLDALLTAMVTYEGEKTSAGSCLYWGNRTARGKDAERARVQIYRIASLLWPSEVLPRPPSYNEVMQMLPNPFTCPGVETLADCEADLNEVSSVPNCVQNKTVEAYKLSFRPNKLWSVVHFFLHNLPDPVPEKTAKAAQALAPWLAQHFTCDDCRGFFQGGVIDPYGLPPLSSKPSDIARWYWYGHNVASEHVATTRGTHPWLMQLAGQSSIDTPAGWPVEAFQHPWFMTWNTAVHQWTSSWKLHTLEGSFCVGGAPFLQLAGSGRTSGECLDECIQDVGCAGFNFQASCKLFNGQVQIEPRAQSTCYKVTRQEV